MNSVFSDELSRSRGQTLILLDSNDQEEQIMEDILRNKFEDGALKFQLALRENKSEFRPNSRTSVGQLWSKNQSPDTHKKGTVLRSFGSRSTAIDIDSLPNEHWDDNKGNGLNLYSKSASSSNFNADRRKKQYTMLVKSLPSVKKANPDKAKKKEKRPSSGEAEFTIFKFLHENKNQLATISGFPPDLEK